MAQFCTKCGAPMGEGMQFCTSCGATNAPAVPPPAAVVTPVSATTPDLGAPVAATPAVATPGPAKSSPVMKIILIIVAVILLLGLITIGSCAYMFYRAKQRVHQYERQLKANFPSSYGTREVHQEPTSPPDTGSTPSPGTGPAVDMGQLAYPGATLGESGNQSIFGAAGIKMQEYFTPDSVDTVLNFYKGKLGNNAMVTQTGSNAVVQVGGTNGLTTINIAPDSSSGKTKITVSSIGKQ